MSAHGDGTRGRTPGGGWRGRYPLRLRRGAVNWAHQKPSWREARPALITEALQRALAGPAGNWYVIGAARDVRPGRPLGRTVAGTELVLWRDESGRLVAGPGACPHLGAPLRDGRVHCGTLICHWHGLALDGGPFAGWEPVPAHDDGVLAWVRLDRAGGESPSDLPLVPPPPDPGRAVDAGKTRVGGWVAQVVVCNPLDPG
ncbi:Rieske (2Fe-2S) protein, partial [Streptomyces niveus]|uniref:Rieske (2Fe-2S) protein n=1 Tax=Streptomyces niveus TaxID=193462 RepID=UPI00368A95B0